MLRSNGVGSVEGVGDGLGLVCWRLVCCCLS